ncbi:MAG: hypothetical protein J3K34DRAFT_519870 [Monoraphidium minutum]|nr:MAG: hypothetical protein J3K34DRAFT_519870 [Monoraphidium minutum]
MDEITRSLKSFSEAIDGKFTELASKATTGLAAGLKPAPRLPSRAAAPAAPPPPRPPPTDAEREAAEAKSDAALAGLDAGYFSQGFDPLAHELAALDGGAKQDDVDAVVERLTAAVDVVSAKLKRHVLRNQDKLIQGITNVTSVDDDVKAAFVMVQGARQQLRMAADDVSAQITIVGATRKKQRLMGALELASRVKQAKDLEVALKRLHESGDFGEAILQCAEVHQMLDAGGGGPLAGLAVAPELAAGATRAYYSTLARLDGALQRCCAAFGAEGYSKLLEGYLLQGIPPPALASKVLTAFKEAMHDAAVRVVRGSVLATKGASAGASPAAALLLEAASFPQLCRQLPAAAARPALQQLLGLQFEIMGSYQRMWEFHEANQAAQGDPQQQRQQQQGEGGGGGSGGGGEEAAAAAAQMELVQAATRALLAAVAGALKEGRAEVAGAAAAKARELLLAPGVARGGDVAQVVGWGEALAAVAGAFVGGPSEARPALSGCYGALLEGYHRSNMESLRQLLAAEQWGALPSGGGGSGAAPGGSIEAALRAGPLAAAAAEWAGLDLRGWLERGSPFSGKQPPLPAADGAAADAPGAATAAAAARTATGTSLRVLQWLRAYASLMAPMPALRAQAWRSAAELFDNYLLACFVLFSGVSLETLAWQDDCLPHRLRSSLLRIMTAEGCKYKPMGPGASFLDFDFSLPSINLGGGGGGGSPTPGGGPAAAPAGGGGGGAPASKFDTFTRRFKESVQEFINTDLSSPYEPGQAVHGGRGAGFGGGGAAASPLARAGMPTTPAQPQSPAARSAQPQQQPQRQAQAPGAADGAPAAGSPAPDRSPSPAPAATAAAVASPAASPAAAPPSPAGAAGRWGLRERVVAVESLTAIADELKAARSALLAAAGGGGGGGGAAGGGGGALPREVEQYLGRTVDAVADLKEAIFRGATTQLMQGMFDADRGTAAQIAAAGYASREPASSYQPWAEALLRHLRGFGGYVAGAGLPGDIQKQMWDQAVKLACDAVLDGLARCRRCSVEGRAAMSLDWGYLEKGLRALLPPGASVGTSLRMVDGYIKAFYMPWEELPRWSQLHLAEYGKAKILALIEAMADAYGVKRSARAALLERLNAELDEFA